MGARPKFLDMTEPARQVQGFGGGLVLRQRKVKGVLDQGLIELQQ